MFRVYSGTIHGVQASVVEIEVDVRQGLPSFELVGLVGMAVKESRERIRAALKNSGYSFPMQRITVNLAPAGMKKDGPLFDLPIALGILGAMGIIGQEALQQHIAAGELSLDGQVRSVHGGLSLAELATDNQKSLLLPKANAQEAAAGTSGLVYGLHTLKQAVLFLKQKVSLSAEKAQRFEPQSSKYAFDHIRGQQAAKRMMQIAVSGRHHALLMGPPGSGKSMLAQAAIQLLPPLAEDEAIQVTKVYSSAGLLEPNQGLIVERPVRTPHHSISLAGLIGGGHPVQPGEITLSHQGVLCLDELLEFDNQALQALREPLETRTVSIIRANERVMYPAQFLLIATSNPCPCGYLGDSSRECRCGAADIRRYHRKLAGPLLDRIDLFTYLKPLRSQDYQTSPAPSPQDPMAPTACEPNGYLTDGEVRNLPMSAKASEFINQAVDRLDLSARAYFKTLRVARTIAELDGTEQVDIPHLAEALQYRWEALSVF